MVQILQVFEGWSSEPKIGQKYRVLTRILKKWTFEIQRLLQFWLIFLKICMKVVLRNTKKFVGVDFWIFCFLCYLQPKNTKNWTFLRFLQLWRAMNSKKVKNQKSTLTTFFVFIWSSFMQISFELVKKWKSLCI